MGDHQNTEYLNCSPIDIFDPNYPANFDNLASSQEDQQPAPDRLAGTRAVLIIETLGVTIKLNIFMGRNISIGVPLALPPALWAGSHIVTIY